MSSINTFHRVMGDILGTLKFASVVPGLLFILYQNDIILLGTLKVSLAVFLIIFFLCPLIFKFSYPLQRHVLFLNFVNWPRNPNYENPIQYGLNGTKNFYINKDNIKLGVWHILPETLVNESADTEYFDKSLKNGEPVFIYMHGNSGNRAAGHRVDLYKLLRKHYHVIAFDYRSYGDSTFIEPSERGLVSDGISVVEFIKNKTNVPIFVWGHSLGTGVATHVLHHLTGHGVEVNGLILESPFNNIRDEVGEHPSAWIFHNLPWFKFTITDPMYENGLRFESDRHITHINAPILILHAEDDMVVPYKLGYKAAERDRSKSQGPVEFRKFLSKFKYGHKFICKAPELTMIISEWVGKFALPKQVDVTMR